MQRKTLKALFLAFVVVGAVLGSLFFASYVRDNDTARQLVEHFGYLGILVTSIFAGINILVPIPAGTFTPIYVAAGFSLPLIIFTITVGTTIGDSIGYLIGVGGKHIAQKTHPTLQKKMRAFAHQHHHLVLPLVFLYSAFSPLPNEVILIPLAVIGIRYRTLLIPLFLGTVLYETLFAYGITSVFHYFF